MGNSITNRSREKSSKRVSELSKKNFVRDSPLFLGKKRIQNITHRMSSRFLNHEKNEPNIDFEMLNEIHDEIIEDEMLFKNDQDFRNEKSHGAKLVKENEGKAECRKKKHLKKSFYHQIVKKSEIGETKSRNTEKFSDKTILNKKKHEMDISKQKDDVKLKVNEECLNKGDISHQFHDSLSDKGFKVSDEQFFDANKSRELTIVGKLSDELNLQLKKDNKEQVVQDFQPEKEKKEKVLSDSEKSFTLPSRHKILKKFSSIEHKKDSSIITIRKNLKFDISKKQMCESETPKVVKVASQSKNTNILSPKVSSSSVSKPKNMILKLSPSKELYVPPPKSEKNDFDEIKQVLLKNPKKLMEAASKIMEKNEYLNFLLDLKSTKELTSYWWKKILNGLSSSRSLSNLLKLSKIGEQKLKDTRDARETTTKQIDAPQKDFLKSPNSIIEKLEKKTSLELEIENAKLKSTGNKKDSAGDKHILKRDDTQGGTSRRNLSLQHQDPSNFSEQQALPYTLVKYLETFESTIDLKNTERVRENSDTSDPQTACSEVCDEKSAIYVEEIKKNNSSSKILFDLSNETQEKEVKNIKGDDTVLLEVPDDFSTNHENRIRVEDQLPPDFIYRSLGKIVEENEELKHPTTEQKYKHYITKEIHKDLSEKSENSLYEAMEFSSTKARCEKTVRSNENAVASESRGSFAQKTAIVLPGREPFQISLISDETSATSRSSVRDKSEKNPLESLSDVLSNCSGPISSLSGKNVIRKKFMKKTNAKRIQKEDIRRATCSTTSSLGTDDSCRPLGKSVPISKQGNFQKRIPRKLDHSLKKPASQNEKSSASPHLPNVESFQNSDENRKIRVIQTKAFSEVLKEDPNLLNRLKERDLMWSKNREMSEQSPRRLEYRFHDFRRKENKSLELRARHLQQRKKDLLSKFKGLIQARKEASDRNRLSTPRVESDQLSPKVFSKIFEKINYFKGLEEKHVDEMSRAKVKNRSLIPTKIPNRRFIHTNHEQVNEDYLSTWVQEHPNVMVTKDKQESSPNCKADTENVIHVPWSPCGCVEGKN
ncbi:hypothetical protein HHI36_010168 [Cryptolaemus montrouzieri]|uniref:Uncharacterized protein n=1 Tax=Cryptolaemus montrouzieri TaxID=559131 RepID=A0ABD2MHW8_9CUCU